MTESVCVCLWIDVMRDACDSVLSLRWHKIRYEGNVSWCPSSYLKHSLVSESQKKANMFGCRLRSVLVWCVNTDWWATQGKEVIWGFFWSMCPSVPASVPTCWRIIRSFTLIISTLESDAASAGTANVSDHPTFLLPSFFLPLQFQNGLTDPHPSENAPGERAPGCPARLQLAADCVCRRSYNRRKRSLKASSGTCAVPEQRANGWHLFILCVFCP